MASANFLPNEPAMQAEYFVNNTDVSVFLTGKAGTGKTTFLRQLVKSTFKRHVVLAPTGVAAINAEGVTIHSFFLLPFDPYLPDVPELLTEYQMPENKRSLKKSRVDIIRSLDLIIIDEISMVRADLLDAVDAVLRRYRRSSLPFGGVQLLMIGDVHQLAPVVTDAERPYIERVYPSPFFFYSKALQRMRYVTIQFSKVFRQQDEQFLHILNSIRENKYSSELLRQLNQRYNPSVDSAAGDAIRLTTHNHQSDTINAKRLRELVSKQYAFDAEIIGDFPESMYPAERTLCLKEGARVMFVKNDISLDRNYYNGKLATVSRIDGDDQITVVDDDGAEIEVHPATWENIKYELDSAEGQITQVVAGTFEQIPLRLAWAVTIHKAQGLTFDKVIVDAAAAFAYGQVYVALSRCRTLQGLYLTSPISENCLRHDAHVDSFDTALATQSDLHQHLEVSRRDYFLKLYIEVFSFGQLRDLFAKIVLFFNAYALKKFPETTHAITMLNNQMEVDIYKVGERFKVQIMQLASSSDDPVSDPKLAARSKDASGYFLIHLEKIDKPLRKSLGIELQNKEHDASLKKLVEAYDEFYRIKHQVMLCLSQNPFTIERYLREKNLAAIEPPRPKRTRSKKKLFD